MGDYYCYYCHLTAGFKCQNCGKFICLNCKQQELCPECNYDKIAEGTPSGVIIVMMIVAVFFLIFGIVASSASGSIVFLIFGIFTFGMIGGFLTWLKLRIEPKQKEQALILKNNALDVLIKVQTKNNLESTDVKQKALYCRFCGAPLQLNKNSCEFCGMTWIYE